jgi:hypothetical protein
MLLNPEGPPVFWHGHHLRTFMTRAELVDLVDAEGHHIRSG